MKEFYKIPISDSSIKTHSKELLKDYEDLKDYRLNDILLENTVLDDGDNSETHILPSSKTYVLTLFEIIPKDHKPKEETDIAYSLLAVLLAEAIRQFSLKPKTTAIKGRLCYIFSMKTETEIRKTQILLEYGMKSVFRAYSGLGFEVICTSSNTHEGDVSLPTAYREALELLLNKKKTRFSGMHYYMDNKIPFKSGYYYPLNKEQHIQNYLKSGDFENLSAELDNIFSVNFDDNTLMPLETIKCFFLNIVGTVLKIYGIPDKSTKLPDIDNNTIIRLILNCTDIAFMINAVKDFFRTCCEDIKVFNIDNKDLPCFEIVKYINQNFSDTELNVSSIAAHFDFHQNHLSRHFKKETGMNLLSYINSVRVKEAKKLLSQTDLTLEHISMETGFGSYRTFMRVFNQVTNMTPGEYRNLIFPEKTL